MTTALAVALAVVLIFVLALLWAARGRSARIDAERVRADELSTRLGLAVDATKLAEERAAAAEDRANQQDRWARDTRLRAEALQALDKARTEREWGDLAGPDAPMPMPWDGGIGAAVGIEAAIIREVVGTPSCLDIAAPAIVADPVAAALLTRVAVEMVRSLARSGEEMTVGVTARAITVTQASDPFASLPDLAPLTVAARAAGGDLSMTSEAEGLTARILLPPADPPAGPAPSPG